MKIGDIVDFGVNDEISGMGILLGVASDQPFCKFWMVLILKRYTDFLKSQPNLALNLPETHLKSSNTILTPNELTIVLNIKCLNYNF